MKKKLRSLIVSVAFLLFLFVYIQSPRDSKAFFTRHRLIKTYVMERLLSMMVPTDIQSTKSPFDVVILGYPRGGSSFIGNILGLRKGNFYAHEPLFRMGYLQYFKPGLICNMMSPICRPSDADRKAANILHALYRCEFFSIRNDLLMWSISNNQSLSKQISLEDCDRKIRYCSWTKEKICKSSHARVSKVLRTDLSIVKEVLERHPNMKIIHLIRDPRAIIHSRRSVWTTDTKDVVKVAKAMCSKMEEDFKVSREIEVEFPGKIMTVFYEDFVQNPYEYSKKLFKFLNWEFTEQDKQRITYLTTTDDSTSESRVWDTGRRDPLETAWKWRTSRSASHTLVYHINNACSKVYRIFKYPKLRTVAEFENTSIPLRLNNVLKYV